MGGFSCQLFFWLSASVTISSFLAQQTESILLQQLPGGSCAKSWNCMPGLVCIDDVCSNCETDDQCMMRNTKNRCQNDTHGVPTCAHKPLMKRKCQIDVRVDGHNTAHTRKPRMHRRLRIVVITGIFLYNLKETCWCRVMP